MPGAALREHADRGADLARCAIAALKAVMLDKSCLQRMQIVALGKTLDGRDGLSVMHHRQRQTGVDAASFNQHRAGAALAVIASLLRTRQREMFTQRIQQRRAWIERQRTRAAVDLKLHRYGRLWRPGIIERAGAESRARERRQEQRRGSGLDHGTPG